MEETFGFHPLTVCADHGALGQGEPLAIVLRPGNAGSNTAAGPSSVIDQAVEAVLASRPTAARQPVISQVALRKFVQDVPPRGRVLA
jgi:hypothetical protein